MQSLQWQALAESAGKMINLNRCALRQVGWVLAHPPIACFWVASGGNSGFDSVACFGITFAQKNIPERKIIRARENRPPDK